MENNDSPKTLKNSEDMSESIDIINTNKSEEKKIKKLKHQKKKKKQINYFFKEVVNLKINNHNMNNKSENLIFPKNNYKSQYYKHVGNTIFLFMDKNDNPLLIIGPHWPLFVCFFSIINILYFIIIFKLWNKFSYKSKITNQISYWSYTLSYLYTSLINPGYPKNNNERKNGYPREEFYLCSVCKFYVKKRTDASHCDDCGICIEGLDHHCPWTSHCIGKNNVVAFYIFIISTLFSICYLPLAFCHFLK